MYYLHIPYLKTFAHEERRPSLRSIPFVVQKNGNVIACNRLAQRKGIFPGMSLIEAHKKSYSLSTITENEKLYEETRNDILGLLKIFEVSIETENGQSAYFDPDRDQRAIDREEFIIDVRNTIQSVFQTELQLGFGPNKTFAYIAGHLAEINKYIVMDEFEAREFISLIPISLLPGLGKRSALLLSGLGVQTIGQFSKLSPLYIMKLFGRSGLVILQRANGEDPRQLEKSRKQQKLVPNFLSRYTMLNNNANDQLRFHLPEVTRFTNLSSLKETA